MYVCGCMYLYVPSVCVCVEQTSKSCICSRNWSSAAVAKFDAIPMREREEERQREKQKQGEREKRAKKYIYRERGQEVLGQGGVKGLVQSDTLSVECGAAKFAMKFLPFALSEEFEIATCLFFRLWGSIFFNRLLYF